MTVRGRRWALFAMLAVLCAQAGAAPHVAANVAAAESVALSGVVVSSDGLPIGGATVTVGDQQFLTDDQGHWAGEVAFAPAIRTFATAPGYVGRGFLEVRLSPGSSALDLTHTLWSIFDADADRYLGFGIPPAITEFTTDTGLARVQEVPAETSAIRVHGTVGDRDGHPLVRGDAYVAHPDDFVDEVPVAFQGGEFTATFPISHGPGVYRVEVNDTTGTALINVPVFVGVPYQLEEPIWPGDDDLSGDGPVQQALAAIQALRQSHGLLPFNIDPRLETVAHDHVADMLAHNWFCHCWADGSNLLDHVRAAGVNVAQLPVAGHSGQFILALGNAYAGYPGGAAIRGLYASPGHRKDLLGSYTHIGIAYGGQVDDATARLSIVYAAER